MALSPEPGRPLVAPFECSRGWTCGSKADRARAGPGQADKVPDPWHESGVAKTCAATYNPPDPALHAQTVSSATVLTYTATLMRRVTRPSRTRTPRCRKGATSATAIAPRNARKGEKGLGGRFRRAAALNH